MHRQRLGLWITLLVSLTAPSTKAGVITLTASATLTNAAFSAQPGTNEFTIGSYEVAELLSFPWPHANQGAPTYLDIIKDGTTVSLYSSYTSGTPVPPLQPVVIAGPATIRLRSGRVEGDFCTFRLTPESYPPDRSIIVPPGTNQTQITLECSTNLLHWFSATNGVYGPLPEAKFFRIKLETVR